MIYDVRKFEKDFIIEGDICIVGAGAAGISIALDWLNHNSKIILLEGGGFEFEDKMQQLYNGRILGPDNYPLTASRLHYFGGTTNHWGGHCSILDEIDFKKRDWVENSGWPISHKDLQPYYKKTSEILELESASFSLEHWDKNPSFSDKLGISEETVIEKIWQYSNPTNFNKKYKSEIEKSNNIHLYTYANINNISANKNSSQIEELSVTNHERKNGKVKAKYFILACGAIQNARLLLSSKDQAEKGLGNQFDCVGRYFMDHIHIRSTEIWLNDEFDHDRYILNWGLSKASSRFSISASKQEDYNILNGSFSIESLIKNRTNKTLFERFSNEDPKMNGYDLNLTERMIRKFKVYQNENINNIDKAFGTQIMMEQAPNWNSRVFLDKEEDALGMNRAGLKWDIVPLEKHSIRKMFELMSIELGIKDLGRIRLNKALLDGNEELWINSRFPANHHMGTTRMSHNPKKGVVDSNCKVHGINNLFIAGSSCFVTSGSTNPTFSLIALSLRLSDHLKKRMK